MPRPLLLLALLLHVAFAASYACSTPTFEGPDENSHYEYAQHIANGAKLPLAMARAEADGLPRNEGAVLGHHPPLYYALLAAVLVATRTDDTVFSQLVNPDFGRAERAGGRMTYLHEPSMHPVLRWLRFVSVALGAISIWLVHRLGLAVCPTLPRVADLAALLVACLPMWSFLHGVLNSDVLATTLSCATVLALTRLVLAPDPTTRQFANTGAMLSLALLTKLTTLFLLPLTALVVAIAARRTHRRHGPRRAWWQAALTFGLPAALSSWWFVRNGALYGDILARNVHDSAFLVIPPEFRWTYFVDGFLPTVFRSLLGQFGWFSLPPHPLAVWVGAGVAILALLGILRSAWDHERQHLPRASWLLLAVLALVFAGTAHFNWTAPQPQGRLLFPAVAPAAVFLAAGLLRITTFWRQRRWLVGLLPLAAAGVFFAWFRPAFRVTDAPAPAEHRSLVGGITNSAVAPAITWQVELGSLSAPPLLRWNDPTATADTRYTLYAYDHRGRIRIASHEWTQGALVIQGQEFQLPDAAWRFIPRGVDLFLKLRRLPRSSADEPALLPATAALPMRRD